MAKYTFVGTGDRSVSCILNFFLNIWDYILDGTVACPMYQKKLKN